MNLRIALCALAVFVSPPTAFAAPVDLSTWSVVQYQLNSQGSANWVLSGGNTVATQNLNADASILLSDFSVANQVINGSWRVGPSGDDDFMGFVFAYQGRGSFYLFDWKKATQNDSLGLAEVGMSVKVVKTAGGDPTGSDFWPTAGSANVTTLFHNSIPWANDTDYDFRLEFYPGMFNIQVRQGANLLLSQTFNDGTFQSGGFGFYNYSQDSVSYRGFTLDPAPPLDGVVGACEPTSIGVWSMISLGIWGISRRRKPAPFAN